VKCKENDGSCEPFTIRKNTISNPTYIAERFYHVLQPLAGFITAAVGPMFRGTCILQLPQRDSLIFAYKKRGSSYLLVVPAKLH